ncbi:hypothetical protein ACTMSW_11370 [Micromonospora sp. BQ11]|uniref:hypothetical protein n=1 Tax=Micromonospora sp. BQ11 TaxID=3452212 RepID=UPI003F886504
MGNGDPYTTISEPTFVARFLLDPDTDTVDTVANVDAFVDLPDGSTCALTIFTIDEFGRSLARRKRMWRRGPAEPACAAAAAMRGQARSTLWARGQSIEYR